MAYLTSTYHPWIVGISLLVATFASYVALDLAKRVHAASRGVAVGWWLGGSVAMGTGIWCMHFVGMLAFTLPIELGFSRVLTLTSWLAGVAASAVALLIASGGSLSWGRLVGGALTMGVGICAMHYIGMASLEIAPGIVWNAPLVAVSVLIAVAASAASLLIFFFLRRVSARKGLRCQMVAALIMGAAICGMHYTGMAAASFPEGSVCVSAGQIQGKGLGALISAAAVGLLVLTLFTSSLDARLQRQATRLAGSLRLANAGLKRANDELRQRTLTDALTGLANRVLFEDRLSHALRRIERARSGPSADAARKLAVFFVDLDGFKFVNDSLGHVAGDDVLIECASRLRVVARSVDSVARVGGDEFVVLLEDVDNPAHCVAIAERMLHLLAMPFHPSGRIVEISASIGVVLYPDRGRPDRLVANADAAMHAAKRAGGNTYSLYQSSEASDSYDQLSLQGELRHAAERGQLRLQYQPKVDARTGSLRGAEALLRWDHPELGILGPSVFIPLAERFGSINQLGNWVIEEACRQMGEWARSGVLMRVAINLSMHQLMAADLVDRIGAALARHEVEPSQLLCEITESVAMKDFVATRSAFEGLAQLGVYLSIDDFGTGHSSLSYLRQLPASQLKIDRSFVNDLESSDDARAIVDAVIKLAHALGLRVVAEGVETAGQRAALASLGCDELQGYLFSRPLSPDLLVEWARGPVHDMRRELTLVRRQSAG